MIIIPINIFQPFSTNTISNSTGNVILFPLMQNAALTTERTKLTDADLIAKLTELTPALRELSESQIKCTIRDLVLSCDAIRSFSFKLLLTSNPRVITSIRIHDVVWNCEPESRDKIIKLINNRIIDFLTAQNINISGPDCICFSDLNQQNAHQPRANWR